MTRWLTVLVAVSAFTLFGLVLYAESDTFVESSIRGATICVTRNTSISNPLQADEAPILVSATGTTYDAQGHEVARADVMLWPKMSNAAKRRVLRAWNESEGAFYAARGLPAPSPVPLPAGLEAAQGEPD